MYLSSERGCWGLHPSSVVQACEQSAELLPEGVCLGECVSKPIQTSEFSILWCVKLQLDGTNNGIRAHHTNRHCGIGEFVYFFSNLLDICPPLSRYQILWIIGGNSFACVNYLSVSDKFSTSSDNLG